MTHSDQNWLKKQVQLSSLPFWHHCGLCRGQSQQNFTEGVQLNGGYYHAKFESSCFAAAERKTTTVAALTLTAVSPCSVIYITIIMTSFTKHPFSQGPMALYSYEQHLQIIQNISATDTLRQAHITCPSHTRARTHTHACTHTRTNIYTHTYTHQCHVGKRWVLSAGVKERSWLSDGENVMSFGRWMSKIWRLLCQSKNLYNRKNKEPHKQTNKRNIQTERHRH